MNVAEFIKKATELGLSKGYPALKTRKKLDSHRAAHYRGVVVFMLYSFGDLEKYEIREMTTLGHNNIDYWLNKIGGLIDIKDPETIEALNDLL